MTPQCKLLCIPLLLTACMADAPDTELESLAKQKVASDQQPDEGVTRDPSDIKLSDRDYTFVNLDASTLGEPPYYLDLDIAFDVAQIWSQSDIECQGCDPQIKEGRTQSWDLKIDGRDISLNTNRLDTETGNSLQAVAATSIYQPLEFFDQSIDLSKVRFQPQTPLSQARISSNRIIQGIRPNYGASFLFRTTQGRIVYFELVAGQVEPNWVLFHVREQTPGSDQTFGPARKMYIKWGRDATGQGIMTVNDGGFIEAYFDFDACFTTQGQDICFSGDNSAPLNADIVDSQPMKNWDLFFTVRVGNWDAGAMRLNGGANRDTNLNDEFDASALYLGALTSAQRVDSDQKSLETLWEFSSIEEFNRLAPQSSKYQEVAIGSDYFTPFDQYSWYDIVIGQSKTIAQPNQRIYLLETTEKEGLAFQISQTDDDANIRQIAYRGPTVKQRRQFDIKFRQAEFGDIRLETASVDTKIDVPFVALDAEIVDAETGLPLVADEFDLLKIRIRPLSVYANLDDHFFNSYDIEATQADAMLRSANCSQLSVSAGQHQSVFVSKNKPDSCSTAIDGNLGSYEITARLPGKDLKRWQFKATVCQNN